MPILDRLRRVPPVVWAFAFGVVLIFPGLGAFGFWDPWELKLADRAREIGQTGNLFDPTAGGRYGREPPLDLALAAMGIKLLGASEGAARMGNALTALGSLLALYWGALSLLRRRAALLSVLALGTMPLFFQQARQLTSDMPLVGGLALSLAGLGRFAWPAAGQRRYRDLAIAALGMLVGSLSGGVLLGAALPCLSLLGALLLGWSKVVRLGGRGRAALVLTAAAGVGLLVATFATANVAGKYTLLLGGAPRGGTPPELFEYFVRQIGFGVFPWSAVAVFALGRAFVRIGDDDEGDPDAAGRSRAAFMSSYLLIAASFGFALSSLFVLLTGDARFAVLAPLALAIGSFLDDALDGERAEPVLGLLAAVGTMVVARDLFLAPEELAQVHLLAKVKWPPLLNAGPALLATGLVIAVGICLGLATRARALAGPSSAVAAGPPATDAAAGAAAGAAPGAAAGGPRGALARRLAGMAGGVQSLVVKVGRHGIGIAVVGAVIFSLAVNHGLIPGLARHFSFKPVFQSFARFSRPGDVFGKYRVEGHGLSFYGEQAMQEIPTQDRLLDFFRQDRRAFCLISTEDLAALDAAFKSASIPYFVVDATSSRFLLTSNRLPSGQDDINPLRRNVWMAPHPPTAVPQAGSTAVTYAWSGDRPPWKWTVPLQATFDDSVELVGADFPSSIRRPDKLKLVLTFRVNRRPMPGYKIFVHVDTPGHPRLIGDHDPVMGAFPTSYWLPGEYVRDEFDIDVPFMTTTAGDYTLFAGLWPGGDQKRLKITAGNINDGSDRARLGTVQIR